MTNPALACRVCQRQPAQQFTIRRHVGLLLAQRFITVKGAFCRDHAVQITKSYLGKTLWQGWWGYISFFVNFFVVGTDLLVLSKAGKMSAPGGPQTAPPVGAHDAAPLLGESALRPDL